MTNSFSHPMKINLGCQLAIAKPYNNKASSPIKGIQSLKQAI
tara:strand:- start:308 stop:433 length:126 start_codon:yes stop_codon:yes gene_type:complete